MIHTLPLGLFPELRSSVLGRDWIPTLPLIRANSGSHFLNFKFTVVFYCFPFLQCRLFGSRFLLIQSFDVCARTGSFLWFFISIFHVIKLIIPNNYFRIVVP